ncbi:RNA polymerase factor sigma-54 [Liquorilactobacillus satsumensis]|uniref:RNA polymerase factor sigma-54 n=1 Tax=Liquorilactobacillus satsumensis TaxID=259059 RepID=UPI0021C2CCDB|nr:RNA polymerase factor sigma-54 [Liquorilactobacillus satsumensis]MCP9313448.1 RNA polymerase factor sigma-54 [Liquorilactobacillus satsumensis]MCP9360627.1 RNA polymerase factor sigma-54 [Liquorilactobacillus satsumensis]
MALEQSFGQEQKQVQKLAMTQKMQQSLQVLRFSIEDLHEFLAQKQLDNPFIVVKGGMNYQAGASATDLPKETFLKAPEHKTQSLFEYLLAQVHLTMRKTVLRGWVVFLIDHLDTNGYLTVDLEEIIQQTHVDRTTLLDALTLLQRLDPPGVGARDLQECLLLQIENDDKAPAMAAAVITQMFHEFADHKWNELTHKFKLSFGEVQQIADYIKTLSPAPGAAFGGDDIGYVYPDLVVKRSADQQTLELTVTKKTQPVIMFKEKYYAQLEKMPDKSLQHFLRLKKNEYAEMLKDLEQRGRTIERVGQVILEYQQEFFMGKTQTLRPLLLRDVAHRLQLHESTISRAVNGKYLKCDQGVFELRSFFKKPVTMGNEASDLSADAVQSQLKALIDAEDKTNPLSDNHLKNLLQKNGVVISRRTVAKYRELLAIPSSTKRKRYATR